jgi:hypothetical protein
LGRIATAGAARELRLFGRRRPAANSSAPRKNKAADDLRLQLPDDVAAAVKRFVAEALDKPYWSDLNDAVKADLARVLDEGLAGGLSGRQIADRVQEALGGVGGRARALRIARTEVTAGLNSGQDAARKPLQEAGLIRGRTWVSIIDKDTREDHADADGQEAEGDAPFVVGGEECRFPGDLSLSPENRVHCRCTVTSIPVNLEDLPPIQEPDAAAPADEVKGFTV